MKDSKLDLVNKINENPEAMTDEEIIKLILSYSFKNDWERIWEKIKDEVVDPTSLVDIESMCMLFGKCDEPKMAFFKTLKRILDVTEYPDLKSDKIYSVNDLGELFQAYIGGELIENLCVAFLSGDDRIIKIKKYSNFERDRVENKISDTVREAIWCKADKVAIAHNHSSGATYFSAGDFRLTQKFGAELNAAGILLLEHFIITKDQFVGILECSK